MEKTKIRNQNEGYMTVFACLLFLVLLSLIFLCLDGIRIHQADSKSKMIAVGAGEHILANYNIPLAKRYHIYFLDSEMEGRIENRVNRYYQTMCMPSQAGFLTGNPLLNLEVKEIKAESFGTMQEQKCLYLKHQIREYMKYDTTKDFLLNTVNQSSEQINRQNQQIRDMKEILDQKESAASQAESGQSSASPSTPSEKTVIKEAADRARKNDPRNIIHQVIKGGVLEFVTDERPISEKYISPLSLPSGSQKEKNSDFSIHSFRGIKEMQNLLKEIKVSDLTEHNLTYLYIKKYFNSYGKEEPVDKTVLDYEMEYILGGQESDRENLRYTVDRLLLMRFAMNCVCAFQDPELNSQALAMAAALAGIAGLPPVVEGIKYTILGAVSFGEALMDVRNLMNGGKVPVIKTGADWKLSVTGASALLEKENSKPTEGLSYEEYLLLLLAVQPDKNRMYLRMQDLMQVNICQEQPEFRIEQCRFGFRMESRVQVTTWFGHGTYDFRNNRVYSY